MRHRSFDARNTLTMARLRFLDSLRNGICVVLAAVDLLELVEVRPLQVEHVDRKPFGSFFSKVSTETGFFTVLGGRDLRVF